MGDATEIFDQINQSRVLNNAWSRLEHPFASTLVGGEVYPRTPT